MKLTLDGIEVERFTSFVDRASVQFGNRGTGLHFLRGRNDAEKRLGANGAGKSSLWDALSWCLYGRTIDGRKGPDVVSWGMKGPAEVTTRLTIAQGRRVVTRSSASPNSPTIDGDAVGQEHVDALIGLNFDAFCATVLLGQGQPLFFDMSPRDKMQLFSNVLNLERWEDRSKAASARVRALELDQTALQSDIASRERELKSLDAMLAKTKVLADEWEEDRNKRLELLNNDLADLERQFAIVDDAKAKADAENDLARTELKQLTLRVADLVRQETTQKAIVNRCMSEIASLTVDKKCPTCGQPVTKKHDHVTHDLLDEAKAALAKLTKTIDPLHEEIRRLEVVVEETDATLRLQVPRRAELTAQIQAIKDARKAKDGEDNPHRQQILEFKKRIRAGEAKLDQLDKDDRILSRRIERTRYWVKGFKQVRLHLIEEVLQELELTTNAMLDEVGLLDWSVQYDIERETKSGTTQRGLTVSVLSPRNKKPVKWECWSGGEGQRLRVIGALALSDVLLNNAGIETGFEILDEPTAHLSVQGVRDLCDYLADRAQALGRQIWLVDHMAVESARFASVLTVVKDDKGSFIEQGPAPVGSHDDEHATAAPRKVTQRRRSTRGTNPPRSEAGRHKGDGHADPR